jgi:hypothetical protein
MKKTVKYVVSVLAVVALLMTCVSLVVFAASPKVTMTTGTTSNGQTEVIVTVSKGSDLATFQAAVKYETDKVKLMSVEYLSGDKNVSNTETDGLVLVNDVWAESLSDATDIIRLVFSGTSESETTFTLEDIKATDSNDNPINFKEPVTVKTKVKANTPDAANDPNATTAPAADSSNGGSNIPGSTDGASPNTGRIIASAAGICGAAAAAAAVVVVLKKKNGKEE